MFFYTENPQNTPFLNPEESMHCVKVLRKKAGDFISVIDGKGSVFNCQITSGNHRKCEFEVIGIKKFEPFRSYKIHIAIAPTKNQDRLEWFVEKCCEMGIDEISLIRCQNSERSKVNLERLEKKSISALKQSGNLFKCKINPLLSLNDFLNKENERDDKFMAHVDKDHPELLSRSISPGKDTLLLIGPEGDFSFNEVEKCLKMGFKKVSMGRSVLRTETAGVVGCNTVLVVNSDL